MQIFNFVFIKKKNIYIYINEWSCVINVTVLYYFIMIIIFNLQLLCFSGLFTCKMDVIKILNAQKYFIAILNGLRVIYIYMLSFRSLSRERIVVLMYGKFIVELSA